MGRGRAKAKQTKVARELKYRGSMTDLDALRAELVHTHVDGSSVSSGSGQVLGEDDDEDDDSYDPYALEDDDVTTRRWHAS